MRIRLMCLKHYCDLNFDGQTGGDQSGPVEATVLYSIGDGTYEFDFSYWECPEGDAELTDLVNKLNREEKEESLLEHQYPWVDYWNDRREKAYNDFPRCNTSWTVVMYSNFTKIGDDQQRYKYNATSNQIEKDN